MNKIINNIEKATFAKIIITICILGDALLIGYIYKKFSNYAIYKKLLDFTLKSQPQDMVAALPSDFAGQVYTMMMQALIAMLALVALLHLFTYFFYHKEKLFAYRYVKIMAWMACPGFILLGLSSFSSSFITALLFILQGLLYFVAAKGLSKYPVALPKSNKS